ncbi:MAG: ComEC/Rec2 family competence protein [Jatrophihabitans sp.]|uniref:ComEC/Rec2 family competence protein n=1 Tax=Jatrophihabitans sp. TaxID=1932789 RepID=UPI003F7F5CF8
MIGAAAGGPVPSGDATTAPEPLDLRLALGAATAWPVTAVLLSASAARVLLAGVIAAVAGLVLLLVPCSRGWCRTAALAGFCTALVLVPLAGRLAHAGASATVAAARAHRSVLLELHLTGDPKPLAATGPGGTARVAVPTAADRISIGGRTVDADGGVLVLAPAAGWSLLAPGQRISTEGRLQPARDGGVLQVVLFARAPPTLLGRPPWFERVATGVRTALRSAASVLPDEERGLLPGLVDGDTTDLDPVLAQHFRTAGLTHLVAVSGTNCSIVIGLVVLVLRRARWRPWLVAVVAGAVLVVFVVVARPSPSVLRAAVMAAIGLVALATGRPRAAMPGLAAAVLVLLVADPTLAADTGFVLSVLATVALLVLGPPWVAALRRRRVPPGVAEAVAVAAAAHVVTAPVIATVSGQVSVVAVPANVLAEPVVAAATVLGFLAAATGTLVAPLGAAFAWLAGWPCRWLVLVADCFGGLPGAVVPWPGGPLGAVALFVVLAAVVALTVARRTRPVVVAALTVAVLVQIPLRTVASGWPVPGWVMVACDVGQGDALVLRAAADAAVVVDAGPDPVPVDRCLADLGVDRVPLLVLTHFHLDHVGGLTGVLRGRSVGRVLVSPLADPASGVDLVDRTIAARGIASSVAHDGAALDIGAVHLDVLGPAAPFHGTRSDPNNSSLVLRATVDGLRILLSADAEIEAQRAMLAAGVDLRADVLKVWHHGSAWFDPAYLAAVHPLVGVISVGLHNDYGHPSPVALQALAAAGVAVARTDHDGDVAVVARQGHPALVVRGSMARGVASPRGVPAGRGARSTAGVATAAGQAEDAAHGSSPVRTRLTARAAADLMTRNRTRRTRIANARARSPPAPQGEGMRMRRARMWSFVWGPALAAAVLRGAPTASAAAPDAVSRLVSVSCPTASFCMTVGSHASSSTAPAQALGYRWDGSSWHLAPAVAVPAGADGVDLTSVSCTSASFCLAAGFAERGSDHAFLLAERWDGHAWHAVGIARPGSTTGVAVSCAAHAACVAVGSRLAHRSSGYYDQAVAWQYAGGMLRLRPTAARPFPNTALEGVDCRTATDCTAVGSERSDPRPLAEHWDGRRWTWLGHLPLSGHASGDPGASLADVACPSAGSCVAVGYDESLGAPLVENRKAGGAWYDVRPSLRPVADIEGEGGLGAVSCFTFARCASVGAIVDRGGETTGLSAWRDRANGHFVVRRSPAAFDDVACRSGVCVYVGSDFTDPDTPFHAVIYRGGARPTRQPLP